MELAFEVAGSGAPVLLLHGLFGSAAAWRDLAEGLAATHRVYAVDLRNHGRSPRSADMSYLTMADDVLRLIEAEGLVRPAIVGHSMGGKVAMVLALTTPYAVGRLVVIDMAPLAYVERWPQPLGAMMESLAREQGRHTHVDWRSNLPAIALSLHELCGFPRHLRHLSTPVPLHAIAGGRSDCVQPADASAFQPMFPNTRVEVIEDAGHWVHADQPVVLLDRLRRALAVTRLRRAPAVTRRSRRAAVAA